MDDDCTALKEQTPLCIGAQQGSCFFQILKPFMCLASNEVRGRLDSAPIQLLNALDITSELSFLATILTGKGQPQISNVALLRRCMGALLKPRPEALDIPWSSGDCVAAARQRVSGLSIGVSDSDAVSMQPLCVYIDAAFHNVDPSVVKSRYYVRGTFWANKVDAAFARLKGEFYCWAARRTDLSPNSCVLDIQNKLEMTTTEISAHLERCETGQSNEFASMAARLLYTNEDLDLKVEIPILMQNLIEIEVHSFLSKNLRPSDAADHHSFFYVMKLVREFLKLSSQDDKYGLNPTVKDTIDRKKTDLFRAIVTRHGITFYAKPSHGYLREIKGAQ